MSCEDIPSLLDLQKVKKHAEDFGRLMGTGTGTSTNGVTGQVRPTYNSVMANLGYTRVGTFAAGGTLLNGRQTLLWDIADGGDGQEYGWSGSFPPAGKVVPPGSTPLTTGGIAAGAWMSRFDPELRIQVREALRRSYAEAGYNLVNGSFEVGGTVSYANDVVLWEPTGIAYAYSGTLPHTIGAGETPVGNQVWADTSNRLLRTEIEGSPLQAAQPWVAPIGTAYAGARKINLVMRPGETLSAHTYPSPTHIDGLAAGDIIPVDSGVLFKFGATGLTSGVGLTQDSYGISNLKIVKGTPEIATFEPWTGHLATIHHLDVVNNGDPTKWALNFKQQNWWPHVIGNTWSDIIDKKGNFCKAIDDSGDPSLRYSANSRMLFAQNRLRWLGTTLGGRGFYGSATANILRDNAMEGASIPVTLGSPSTFTAVDGLYTESPYGNQCVMQLGDDVAAPNNVISYVEARHVYNNMHGLASNKIVQMGHDTVVLNHFKLDEVFITGSVPSQPVISINDITGQKIEVGRIESGGMPLLPMTNNHVNVLDMLHQSLEFMNGDLSQHGASPTTIPAGVYTKVANGWYMRSAGGGTCYFDKTGADSQKLRMSRQFAELAGIPAGAQVNIVYEHINPTALVGTDFTVQFLAKLNQTVNATISVEAWSATVRQTLYTTTKTLTSQWSEQSMTIYGNPSMLAGADVLAINIQFTPTSAAAIDITGVRGYRGSCGLCLSPSDISVGRTIAETNAFPSYIVP